MIRIFLVLVAFFALAGFASGPDRDQATVIAKACTDPASIVVGPETMPCLVEALVQAKFPTLRGISIQLRVKREKGYFLMTDIDAPLKSARKRKYFIEYNPDFFQGSVPLTQEALTAILAHELVHIRDYVERTSAGVATLLTLQSSRKYERSTDRETLKLGFADGLIAFRQWIYARLDADDLEIKKRNYLTPEEIKEWLANLAKPSP
ncbi:MAG: hypothetical protein JNL01_15970 [Bdellovibrionales bacterium]|nr:hypothetical protein [Bdellovibrionales bacterium]